MSEIIVNTFDQLRLASGGIAIVVSYGTLSGGVDGYRILRVVRGKIVVTDESAAWYHHKQKWFSRWSPDRAERASGFHAQMRSARERAMAWVEKTYGEKGPWVGNRRRDYVPKRINDQWPIPKREKRE